MCVCVCVCVCLQASSPPASGIIVRRQADVCNECTVVMEQ